MAGKTKPDDKLLAIVTLSRQFVVDMRALNFNAANFDDFTLNLSKTVCELITTEQLLGHEF